MTSRDKRNTALIIEALRELSAGTTDASLKSACEWAILHPGMPTFLHSWEIAGTNAPRLGRMVLDHWHGRDLSRHWVLQ